MDDMLTSTVMVRDKDSREARGKVEGDGRVENDTMVEEGQGGIWKTCYVSRYVVHVASDECQACELCIVWAKRTLCEYMS